MCDSLKPKWHGMPRKETYLRNYANRDAALAGALSDLLKEENREVLPEELLKDLPSLYAEVWRLERRSKVFAGALQRLNPVRSGSQLVTEKQLTCYLKERLARSGAPLSVVEKQKIKQMLIDHINAGGSDWANLQKRCLYTINMGRQPEEHIGLRRIQDFISNVKRSKEVQDLANERGCKLRIVQIHPGTKAWMTHQIATIKGDVKTEPQPQNATTAAVTSALTENQVLQQRVLEQQRQIQEMMERYNALQAQMGVSAAQNTQVQPVNQEILAQNAPNVINA